jgi:hypothetical protein
MYADQTLASARGLLPPSGKEQPGTWLPHAGFHALIGRIFSAALKCYFHTGRIVSDRHVGWDESFLPQFSCRRVERENQVTGFPLKRL